MSRPISPLEPTRYEVALTRARDGARVLLGYTPRHSTPGLHGCRVERGRAIVAFLGAGERAVIAPGRTRELVISDRGRVVGVLGFTGRTQRDARRGPLPLLPRDA